LYGGRLGRADGLMESGAKKSGKTGGESNAAAAERATLRAARTPECRTQ